MPKFTILTEEEISLFEKPPEFTGKERAFYFDQSSEVKAVLDKLRTTHTKTGFILQNGYFKATGRFFKLHRENQEDISYVQNMMGVLPDKDVAEEKYSYQVFHVHRKTLLNLHGILPFDSEYPLFLEQVQSLTAKHLFPKKVFFSLVEWLRSQKIEVPSYNGLARILTKARIEHEKNLLQRLERLLSANAKAVLDGFISETGTEVTAYRLKDLKRINQSEKPGRIKKSIEAFSHIKNAFTKLCPVINELGLPPATLRAYAQWATKSRGSQMAKLTDPLNRYLHLLAFLNHQYSFRQDCFVKILLNTYNRLQQELAQYQKDTYFGNREVLQNYTALLHKTKESYKEKWLKTCEIVGLKNMSNSDKIKCISALEDRLPETEYEREITDLEQLLSNATRSLSERTFLTKKYLWLKNRMGGIISNLEFNSDTSNQVIMAAINAYKHSTDSEFCDKCLDLLGDNEREGFYDKDKKTVISLFKVLFFTKVADFIKKGDLNLSHSYKYLSVEEYLIPKQRWKNEKSKLLEKAGLNEFISFEKAIGKLQKQLDSQYEKTNGRIMDVENGHVKINEKTGKVTVHTPGVDTPDTRRIAEQLAHFSFVPIGEILSETEDVCGYMQELRHRSPKRAKGRPAMETFLACIIAYGCNIGTYKMGQIARGVTSSTLANTAKWYFSEDNVRAANNRIVNLTRSLPIHRLFRHEGGKRQTSSDGQKYDTAVESLNASYSFKYFKSGKRGSTVYGFVDESVSTLYTTVITASEREATYVLDGLLYNEVYWEDKTEWVHHTDTHGFTEVVFTATNMLGIDFAPRIKNLKDQQLYAFESPSFYKEKGYPIFPSKKVNTTFTEEQWDNILRLVATIRLKETTASSIFSRLQSYARQHPLYRAIKELGRIYKSLFILKYYDSLELRQMTEKQLNKGELSHWFAHAVFFDNNREIREELKEDQDTVMACRVLIQNAIILWNCMRLSDMMASAKNEQQREELIKIVRNGSPCSWAHINMQGEYKFDEKAVHDPNRLQLSDILEMELQ